jgi:hypothetical protein
MGRAQGAAARRRCAAALHRRGGARCAAGRSVHIPLRANFASGGIYHATVDELQGIDRGLKAAREARFASDVEVKEVFAKHRPAGRLSIRRKRLPTSTLFWSSYPRIIRVCTLPLKGEYRRSRRALAHSRRALRRSSSGRVSASCLSFVIPIKYSNGLKMT